VKVYQREDDTAMPETTNQTVVITGATAGVGRATAFAFARRGWRVGLVARGQEGLEGTAEEVRLAGGTPHILKADVTDPARVEEVADEAERVFGPIDVWVNAAMANMFSPFEEMTPEEFRRVTEVTYLGTVHGTLAALKRMRARDHGTIVQVGSVASYRAIPLQSAYSGAKFAARGFTDALRCELLHDRSRVRLSMVQLPSINTPLYDWARSRLSHLPRPFPPVFQPEVAAHAVVRAAMEGPREIWVGRQAVQAIIGAFLAPATLDRMLARRGWSDQISHDVGGPDRSDNLFEPTFGAAPHGRFTGEAESQAIEVVPEMPNPLRPVAEASLLGFGLAAMTFGGIVRRLTGA